MDAKQLKTLQNIRQYPCVSILLPTHRTSPDNQQDAIKIKNLVKEAEHRLLEEFSKREVEPVLSRLHELADSVNVTYNLDGLALFVNASTAEKFDLPFPVKERVIIDQTFATRDLIMAMNRSIRYYVMTLSAHQVHLYEAYRDTLRLVEKEGFPHTYESDMHDNPQRNIAGDKDTQIHEFFNRVDKSFHQVHIQEPLNLVLVGTGRNLAIYREVADNKRAIVQTVEGNYENHKAHEVGEKVWPEVRERLLEQRNAELEELHAAVGAQKYVSGVGEVWRMAKDGRGRILFVEEDYRQAAQYGAGEETIELVDDPTAPGVVDDLVDEIAELVMQQGGRVVFVDNDTLKDHQRIALALRY